MQASTAKDAGGAAAFGSQARQLSTEGAAVSGLKVSAGHATHADWLTSSLNKPGEQGWQKKVPAPPRAKWKPAWQRHC